MPTSVTRKAKVVVADSVPIVAPVRVGVLVLVLPTATQDPIAKAPLGADWLPACLYHWNCGVLPPLGAEE